MSADTTPAVIYAARSASEARDGRESTTSQLEVVRARLGRLPIAEFKESGFSGSKRNRGPELQAAIEAAVAAAAEHGRAELWAFHSSRFGRGSGKLGEARAVGGLFYDLRAQGVSLRTVEDDEFVTNEQLIGIASSQASKYADDLSANLKRGMREAAERGDWMGRGLRLDGYAPLREVDSRGRVTKTWIKDPDRKHIWELIWEMALDGKSIQAIQLECSSRGFLTAPVRVDHRPRPFDVNRLAQSLDRAAYAGLVVYHGEVLEARGNWPAYVEPEDFYRLREERRARANTTKRPSGRPVVGYLLAELATCSCGRRMRVETYRGTRRDGTRTRRYVCQSHRDHHRDSVEWCSEPPIDAVEADRIVLSGIDTLLADADSLRGQLLAGRRAEQERYGQIAQQAREDAVAAERAADRAEARYADALAADDEDACEVLLSAAAGKRREARQAMERADAALDALSSAAEEPEGEQADAVLSRVWEALSGRVADADGDVRKLNAALREWFEAFTLHRPVEGVLWVGPILSADAVARVLRDPDGFPGYVRAVDTAGTLMIEPPVLTAARKPFLTSTKTSQASSHTMRSSSPKRVR
jgi:DNA invertase Pin-like site-specific DNA recombinase